MKTRNKLVIGIGVGLLFVVSIPLVLFFSLRTDVLPQGGNVTVEVVSGEGGMPPDISNGSPLKGRATAVFTRPFKSLSAWEEAAVVEKIEINNGKGTGFLLPGTYGLYLIVDGEKYLYGDLQLTPYDVLSNPGPRSERGDWYVEVNPFINTFKFSINKQPS